MELTPGGGQMPFGPGALTSVVNPALTKGVTFILSFTIAIVAPGYNVFLLN